MLKRSSRMSFFPNFYVFPGGSADDADFSSEWLDLLSPSFHSPTSPCSPRESLFRLFSQETKDNPRAPILARDRDPKYRVIPSDIAFRISAIRETFEETGILLARKAGLELGSAQQEQNYSNNNNEVERDSCLSVSTRRCTAKVCDIPAEQLNEWRHRILKKSDNFLKMCRELDLVPDLTALSEWSNWLTPILSSKKPKRFDTIFFVSFVDHLPNVTIFEKESTQHAWQSPAEYLAQFGDGSIYLGPPQIYELQFMNFHSWESFHNQVEHHPYFHAKRMMPMKVNCKDGLLIVFPGDDKYPKAVDLKEFREPEELLMTKQEFADSNCINHHYDPEKNQLKRNMPFSPLRARPEKYSILSSLLKSKL